MNTRKALRSGFTLVEMMVVIVIIGILATVIIVNIAGKADKAKVEATKAIVKQVGDQVEMFNLHYNRYPVSLDDLTSASAPSYIEAKDWHPLLTESARDGWGNPLVYRQPGSDGFAFDVLSYGQDGKELGEGYAADIWNHQHK